MRVLIAGGGVAGLALAGLLERQGRDPEVAERSTDPRGEAVAHDHAVELHPLGTAVFHGLHLAEELAARSVALTRHRTLSEAGDVLHEVDLAAALGDPGACRGLAQVDLLDVLDRGVDPRHVRLGTEVVGAAPTTDGSEVVARFADGTEAAYDVVVAADGMRSELRAALWGEVTPYETDWVVATWWSASPDLTPPGTISEHWGPGAFVRLCPLADRVGVVVGTPVLTAPPRDAGPAEVLAGLAAVVGQGCEGAARLPGLFDAVDGRVARWPLQDVRAPGIVTGAGRIALCGDAGTAFLPAAGAGASNALRSAAALAYELSLAGPADVPAALERWRRRVEPLVRAHQNTERSLARLMLADGGARTRLADLAVEHYPVTRLVASMAGEQAELF